MISRELYLLGYEILPFDELNESILSDKSHSCDLMSDENRAFLWENHGLEAILTGEYSVVTQIEKATAHLEVNLIDIETGDLLWHGRSDEQSWPVKVSEEQKATDKIVAVLMKSLKKDIEKYSEVGKEAAKESTTQPTGKTTAETVEETATTNTSDETTEEIVEEPAEE